ncbi:MAG: hypothetical protein FWE70_07960, partial [Oscillospiraceae bacterium]|nr:hypothetical protein [Oscillospiraceae bacterium]
MAGSPNVRHAQGVTVISGVGDFDADQTFGSGQAFRWVKGGDGRYHGIVGGKAVSMESRGGTVTIYGTAEGDYESVWRDYLDLGTDYGEIKRELSRGDPTMGEATRYGWGLRLLRQDAEEALLSFILSSNNRIPMIMRSVELLSAMLGDEAVGVPYGGMGEPVAAGAGGPTGEPMSGPTEAGPAGRRAAPDGDAPFGAYAAYTGRRAFPSAAAIAGAGAERLGECRAGFRCRYLAETAAMLAGEGTDLRGLGRLGREGAREALMRYPGVGAKVADCA